MKDRERKQEEIIQGLIRLNKLSINLNKKMLWEMKFHFIWSICWMIIFLMLGILIGVEI